MFFGFAILLLKPSKPFGTCPLPYVRTPCVWGSYTAAFPFNVVPTWKRIGSNTPDRTGPSVLSVASSLLPKWLTKRRHRSRLHRLGSCADRHAAPTRGPPLSTPPSAPPG